MKYIELVENRDVLRNKTQVFKLIKENCQEILDVYKMTSSYNPHAFLYRGIGSNDKLIFSDIRQDRRPTDMNNLVHEILHDRFQSLGIETTRKNSIFTTPLYHIANNWGKDTYIIFPFDGFKYVWFRGLKDYSFWTLKYNSNEVISRYASKYLDINVADRNHIKDIEVNQETLRQLPSDKFEEMIKEIDNGISKLNPETVMIEYAIVHKAYEILVSGSKYIGINNKIFENLKDDILNL